MPTLTVGRAFRDPGTFISQSVVLPADAETIDLVPDLADADLNDATLTMSIAIEISLDGGATWQVFARANDWQGGLTGRTGVPEPPRVSFTRPDVKNARARMILELSKRVRIGLVATY